MKVKIVVEVQAGQATRGRDAALWIGLQLMDIAWKLVKGDAVPEVIEGENGLPVGGVMVQR